MKSQDNVTPSRTTNSTVMTSNESELNKIPDTELRRVQRRKKAPELEHNQLNEIRTLMQILKTNFHKRNNEEI